MAVTDSFPGDCKVGLTLRSVPERMAELQRHYRTRHLFTARSEFLVKNPARVEWLAHRRLARYRKRGTELFECSPEIGREAVLWAIDKLIEEERQNAYVLKPRLERAPKRWRKARPKNSIELAACLCAAVLLVVLFAAKPAIPVWVPPSVRFILTLAESVN